MRQTPEKRPAAFTSPGRVRSRDPPADAGKARFRVDALVEQKRVDIEYRGVREKGDVTRHTFDPFTLTIYKGGLYLIGYSFRREKNIYLAVERIEKVTLHPAEDGQLVEYFRYPEAYSPEQFTQGMFGIWDGPETDVELEIMRPETLAYLEPRKIHPTQKFRPGTNGSTLLTMKVRGTTELATWILGFAPWIRVRKPKALRDEVQGMLEQGLALYQR